MQSLVPCRRRRWSMKIQGTFLSSRAARRIFWTLLLAAAVPIAVFGVSMHTMLSAQFESQAKRQQLQLIKFAGMGLLDRLLVARTALTIVSRTGRVADEPRAGSRSMRVLLEAAQIDGNGNTLAGSAALVQRWRERVLPLMPWRGGASSTLLIDRELSDAPRLLMVLLDEVQPQRLWIAEVDPAFLFSELSAEANGARICVFEAPARPVH